LMVLAGCGDRCEVLCQQAASRVAQCKPDSLTWNDLGARSRNDFFNECRRDWDRARIELPANDLTLALEVCFETNVALGEIECDEVVALYGPTP